MKKTIKDRGAVKGRSERVREKESGGEEEGRGAK